MKVRTTFFADGRCFAKGQEIPDDDPIIAGREALFVQPAVAPSTVETATAAPGEKRSARRPRKS